MQIFPVYSKVVNDDLFIAMFIARLEDVMSKKEITRMFKELMLISAPIMLEHVFISVMGIVNQLMAANVIGEYAVSAVGMINSVSEVTIGIFMALATGGTIVVAQMYGRRDFDRAKKAGAQAVTLSIFVSVLVFVGFSMFRLPIVTGLLGGAEQAVFDAGLDFFTVIIPSFPMLAIMQTCFGIVRGSGNTRTPMQITLIMNVVNVVLGFLLIFSWEINILGLHIISPSFGIIGAGLALTLSRLSGMILIILYIFTKSKTIRFNSFKDFLPSLKVQKDILGIGVPTGVENSMFQVGRLITQMFIVGMGTSALFANNVAGTIFGFLGIPGFAFSQGVMIMLGQMVGRGEYGSIKKTCLFTVVVGSLMFTVFCLILFPMSGFIASSFNASEESAAILIPLLHFVFITTPIFWSTGFVTPAALRAIGDVRYTMYVGIATMWGLRIVMGYVLGIMLGFGLMGVWYAMVLDWIVRTIFFQYRLIKGKWMKNLPKVEGA